MADEKKSKKDSNELLNILIIIIGAIFILKGVLELLALGGIIVPEWLEGYASDPDLEAALTILGAQGLLSTVLGFWCIIAGIGLFREEEYALGMGLVVLSIMAVQGVTKIIEWVKTPSSFDMAYWPNWIIIVAFIVGLLGFFWLLFTYKRYD